MSTINMDKCEIEVQVGGARVRVLRESVEKGTGRFRGMVKSVTLSLELPRAMMVDPRGPEMFAETLIDLANRYDPYKKAQTKVGIIFESSEMSESVGMAFKEIRKIRPEEIVQNMALMSQSNKSSLELDVPKITVRMTYLNVLTGSGKRKFDTGNILELTAFKKKLKLDVESQDSDGEDMWGIKATRSNIMPNDVLEDCLPHALYQTLMYHEWKQSRSVCNRKKYRSSVRKTYKRPGCCLDVYDAVNEMKQKSGMTKSSNFDRLDVEQFQKTVFVGTHQIVVFVKNSTIPYYKGPYVGEGKQLTLYLSDGHYRGVRSVCALLKTEYYCFLCNARYRDAASHYKCPLIHRLCGQKNCQISNQDEKKRCEICTVMFRSHLCYENHLKKGPKNGKNRCEYTRSCKKCSDIYYTNKNKDTHNCGEKWCYRCNCKRIKPHQCIMPESKKNERKLTRRRVYFDIESRADEKTGQQFPVLFVALRCCPACSTVISKDPREEQKENCEQCAPDGRLKIIECITTENRTVDVASELTRWLFGDHHKGSVVIAHNASGYDAQFILENMISSNKASPKLILEGTKLIFMEYNGVRLLDSMKFLTMSLASMGKAFEIDSIKGDFPVLFIKSEHYDYNGPLPEDKWYDLDNKSSSVKRQITNFLEKERGEERKFNFFDEIMKYCYNDVYILAKALNLFETEFESMTNVCLLEEAMTAASAAALVFRRKHLDPSKPIVLDVKPSVSVNNSVISQKYLAWFSRKEGVQVRMSTTYGEEKVGKYRVDGFVVPCEKFPDGLIIEFFGCYWHAHNCTYTETSMIGYDNGKDIWTRDAERIESLEKKHPVKIVWECEVKQKLLKDIEMAEFFENYEPVGILHCEKSLAGGRTEVFRLCIDNIGRTLRYLDVVSLYPTVMKHEAFPFGPPENVPCDTMKTPMTKPDDIPFRGFLSCRVSPPRHLKLPVLSIKMLGKLIFGLCKQCAKDMNEFTCSHSDEKRSFNGTFTTVELRKALSLGYCITEVYHGVKYEHWAQNDEHGEGGLFTSYINQMMEEKIYSSGWPSDVKTEEEKKAFCNAYMMKEHIKLTDYSRFKKNPGKRAVAKLMLNSLWGKFAQNVDRESTNIIIDPVEFWNLVYDTNIVITVVRCVNDVLVVKYRKQAETLESLKTSAMQLAAYTTSYARLRLYRFMELVGDDNIVYTDTDSIIYGVPDGQEDPLEKEEGPYLGQLTDELEGVMTEFVTLGPKTYCYKEALSDGEEKVVRKAKGFTINSVVDKKMTFGGMRSMVQEVLDGVDQRTRLQLPQHTMYRDSNHRIFSRKLFKGFQFTFTKRRILADGTTSPYGFCE